MRAYNIRVRMIKSVPWCAQKNLQHLFISLMRISQCVFVIVKKPDITIIGFTIICIVVLISAIFLKTYHDNLMYNL
jgi:hypothetical protein